VLPHKQRGTKRKRKRRVTWSTTHLLFPRPSSAIMGSRRTSQSNKRMINKVCMDRIRASGTALLWPITSIAQGQHIAAPRRACNPITMVLPVSFPGLPALLLSASASRDVFVSMSALYSVHNLFYLESLYLFATEARLSSVRYGFASYSLNTAKISCSYVLFYLPRTHTTLPEHHSDLTKSDQNLPSATLHNFLHSYSSTPIDGNRGIQSNTLDTKDAVSDAKGQSKMPVGCSLNR
jgi:hypothetical protein